MDKPKRECPYCHNEISHNGRCTVCKMRPCRARSYMKAMKIKEQKAEEAAKKDNADHAN